MTDEQPAVPASEQKWPSWWLLGLQLAALWCLGLVRPLFATFAAVETAAPAVSYSFAARLAAPGGGGGGEHNGSARREP